MLIDGLELQDKVFEAGIPNEMMSGLDGLDMVGVGVLPGQLRKMLGIEKAFTKPEDFAGATIGIQDSAVSRMTFAAVGATTANLPVGADLSGVDGYEVQLAVMWGNHYDEVAKAATTNLNLWPRPLVLFIGKPAYDRLNDSQRAALTGAAATVRPAESGIVRDEDAAAVQNLCAAGMTLATATDADLDAFTKAWAPVYDQLRTTPATRDWIDRIAALKASTATPPDTASCEDEAAAVSGADPSSGPALEDGTYETVLTPADYTAACKPGDRGAEYILPAPDVPQTLQFDVKGNHFLQYQLTADGRRERGSSGTYTIFRDTFQLQEDNAQSSVVSDFTLENGVLTLTNMQTDYCDAKLVWTTHPWTKIR